jgi:hypothetical protein
MEMSEENIIEYEEPRTITDKYGREITVTNDERGYTYTMPGLDVGFDRISDDRVLDMAAMFDAPPPEPAPLDRAAIGREIDDAVEAVTSRYTRFLVGYERREAQAQAYKDAGYTGDVPLQVAAFATPANKTPQEATDIILAQAAALRGALDLLEVQRMRKYEVYNAATDEIARAARADVLSRVAGIGASLG